MSRTQNMATEISWELFMALNLLLIRVNWYLIGHHKQIQTFF